MRTDTRQSAGAPPSCNHHPKSRDRQGAVAGRCVGRTPVSDRFLTGAALKRAGACEPRSGRLGFTLVELLVVVGIVLLLTVMTIGAINLSITSERVRSGARQVQSLIEGARDRAIYARQPRGIRLLVNEQITETVAPGLDLPTISTTIVYIGSPGEDTSLDDRDDVDRDGLVAEPFKYINVVDPTRFPNFGGVDNRNDKLARRAIIGVNTNWTRLAENGLIGPGTVIRISPLSTEDARTSSEFFTIHPDSFPVRSENYWFRNTGGPPIASPSINFGPPNANPRQQTSPPNPFGSPPNFVTDDEVLFLTSDSKQIESYIGDPADLWHRRVFQQPWYYVMETGADVLPGEEPSILPSNVCIDLETSHLPPGWLQRTATGKQFSNRMDILFSPNGGIVGDAGAAGLIHLHVSDVSDAIANVPPGSPIDAMGEPRHGDELGVTIFTRAGRVNVHPMNAVDLDSTSTAVYPPMGPVFGGNGEGVWANSTAYGVGDVVAPPVYNGLLYQVIPGAAGNSTPLPGEPDWNLAPGGLTQDNGIVWVGIKHDIWSYGVEGDLSK